MKSDKKIYQKVIQPGSKAERYEDRDVETPAHRKALDKIERRHELITVADQIAGYTDWETANWKWPGSDEAYPHRPSMRVVDKVYKRAQGGMLLVDEPKNEYDVNQCYEKQKIIKKLGMRHIVVEHDTRLDQALEQLGEL